MTHELDREIAIRYDKLEENRIKLNPLKDLEGNITNTYIFDPNLAEKRVFNVIRYFFIFEKELGENTIQKKF